VRQVRAHADPAKAPKTPVDLNEVLRDTERFVRSRREFSHVRFLLDLAESPLVVRGSPVMLGQVAVNLILNACEVQPEAGEVSVTSRREGSHVVLDFADRGPGIAEPDRERVFEPFSPSATPSSGSTAARSQCIPVRGEERCSGSDCLPWRRPPPRWELAPGTARRHER
jgi:signal transduction histidine kinase